MLDAIYAKSEHAEPIVEKVMTALGASVEDCEENDCLNPCHDKLGSCLKCFNGALHDKKRLPICDGWPLNLLIPRGTKQGMRGTMYVLATDWMNDGENPQEPLHGSWPYCGQKGVNAKYPDTRPMGFPFDRPIYDKRRKPMSDIDALVDNVPNSCKTNVRITFLGPWDKDDSKQKDKKGDNKQKEVKGDSKQKEDSQN